jgi:hypothetical protein
MQGNRTVDGRGPNCRIAKGSISFRIRSILIEDLPGAISTRLLTRPVPRNVNRYHFV